MPTLYYRRAICLGTRLHRSAEQPRLIFRKKPALNRRVFLCPNKTASALDRTETVLGLYRSGETARADNPPRQRPFPTVHFDAASRRRTPQPTRQPVVSGHTGGLQFPVSSAAPPSDHIPPGRRCAFSGLLCFREWPNSASTQGRVLAPFHPR
jgi:hypothetical protein